MRGCEGRLRVGPWPKLLGIQPPQAGNSFITSKMPRRRSPGHPTVFAAPVHSLIRAGDRHRHENRNRHKSSL